MLRINIVGATLDVRIGGPRDLRWQATRKGRPVPLAFGQRGEARQAVPCEPGTTLLANLFVER